MLKQNLNISKIEIYHYFPLDLKEGHISESPCQIFSNFGLNI